jgi:serine/threonine protein kinase
VKAVRCPDTREIFAAKIFYNDFPPEIVMHESRIMENLRGFSVVRIFQVSQTGTYHQSDGNQKRCSYILMELCTNGDLYDLTQTRGGLSLSLTKTIFIQILSAVSECHSQQVFHRDLKPDNILFTSDFQVKLADFGSSQLSEELPDRLHAGKFTAPESTKAGYQGEYSREGDVFSLGCILFYLVAKTPPFFIVELTDMHYRSFVEDQGKFWKVHSQRIKNGHEIFTQEFKELVGSMINPDPRLRPTVEDVRKHPWLDNTLIDIHGLRDEIFRKRNEALEVLQKKREDRKNNVRARFYRGNDRGESFNDSLSLSLNETLCKKFQDECFCNKFTQVRSWLDSKRLSYEVNAFLSKKNASFEIIKDTKFRVNYVTELDSFDFKITVYEMDECNLVYFKPLNGVSCDLIEIIQQFVKRLDKLIE